MEYEDNHTGDPRPAVERFSMSKAPTANDNGRQQQVEVCLCIPEDQQRYLPKRRCVPTCLSPDVPLPRRGEIVYLSSSSAWGVAMVIHEWRSPTHLCIEVWLEHVSGSRHTRPTGFMLTQ